MKYKCRAECLQDCNTFIDRVHTTFGIHSATFNTYPVMYKTDMDTYIPLSDTIMEIDTDIYHRDLLHILKAISDLHLMYQTFKPIDRYTGRRDRRRK